jgi:hypothetical protein
MPKFNSAPSRANNSPSPHAGSAFKIIITHAEGVSLLNSYVYLFGVNKLRECPDIDHAHFNCIERLPSREVREGVRWIAKTLPDQCIDARPSYQLRVLCEEVDALGLSTPGASLYVAPRTMHERINLLRD